ncbi:MAG: TIGR02281 family clan AA aspartic protease [Candidatus Rokubacteria bacterium]|nr:TIGR02281 family clan AA aspartic protease [Candidatus Rokubacteria bacterium]
MRRWLTLAIGTLIGQWLAFSGITSPAEMHTLGLVAFARNDYAEAARMWSHAVSLQPDNPTFHYLRATALARLGHATSAADAYQLALLHEPSEPLAKLAADGLARLASARTGAPGAAPEATVPLEASRGVWVAHVTVNGAHAARFLVDTGASVTLVSPRFARTLGLAALPGTTMMPLQTVAGQTTGASAVLASVRLGTAEARDVPAVVHDPGLDLDGILGNSFLGRFIVTFDADRRLLHLRGT